MMFIDVKTIHYTGDIGHLSTKYLGNYLVNKCIQIKIDNQCKEGEQMYID
jgi:hypothetical protein